MTNPLEKITGMVSAHPAASWVDPRNGRMPMGFAKGAALGWGRFVERFQRGATAAVFCSKANTKDAANDALSYYAGLFKDIGLDNSKDGLATLRHTWILACCLAGPESSWKWWVGVDTTNASSETADTAEAGVCQTSWNSHTAKPELTIPLFQHYLKVSPESLLWRDVFSEGTGGDENHAIRQIGIGVGAQFQALSKLAPTFALEYACIILRCLRAHYGTIRDHKVNLNPHMDDMFQKVEAIMAADPAVVAALSDTPTTVPDLPVEPPPHRGSVLIPLPAPPIKVPPMATPTVPAQVPAMPSDLLDIAKTAFPFLDSLFPTWEPALVGLIRASTLPGAPILASLGDFVLKAARQALVAQIEGTVATPTAGVPSPDIVALIEAGIKQALAKKFQA